MDTTTTDHITPCSRMRARGNNYCKSTPTRMSDLFISTSFTTFLHSLILLSGHLGLCTSCSQKQWLFWHLAPIKRDEIKAEHTWRKSMQVLAYCTLPSKDIRAQAHATQVHPKPQKCRPQRMDFLSLWLHA